MRRSPSKLIRPKKPEKDSNLRWTLVETDTFSWPPETYPVQGTFRTEEAAIEAARKRISGRSRKNSPLVVSVVRPDGSSLRVC